MDDSLLPKIPKPYTIKTSELWYDNWRDELVEVNTVKECVGYSLVQVYVTLVTSDGIEFVGSGADIWRPEEHGLTYIGEMEG